MWAASNHKVYDLRQEKSLAGAACDAGYHVWLVDLRGVCPDCNAVVERFYMRSGRSLLTLAGFRAAGSGMSEKASKTKRAVNWDVNKYVEDVKVSSVMSSAYSCTHAERGHATCH